MSLGSVSSLSLVVRGSKGFCLQAPEDFAVHQGFVPDLSKSVKVIAWTRDGKAVAWSNMETVQIAREDDNKWIVEHTIPQTKVFSLSWSPGGTMLATWEQYATTAGKQPQPNLHLFDTNTGERVKSFFQKKMSNWCPMWSLDEKICSRMVNNEVQFYENSNFDVIAHKIHLAKVSNFSMAPGNSKSTHVVTYIPGSKGAPSFTKLYQYPSFDDNQVLANKSFFQADSVDFKWNSLGTTVLLLTQAEVDKTGGSYYGKQQLHYMSTKCDTGMVGLAKEGPIYAVEWSPNGSLFAACYGFMPAKATMFNTKAEAVFDFGTGPRNEVLFNPQTSLLMIGGFGNLRGHIQMWDVAAKTLVSEFDAPDSTNVSWCPDGQRLLTTTCAPRLRMGNGYKVWHYSGSLLHEKSFQTGDELWEADWQAASPGSYEQFKISKAMVGGIQPTQPQVSKQAYRPPGARGTQSTFKLHDDEEAPQNTKKNDAPENMSKSALKNKKRKEAAEREKKEAAKSKTKTEKDKEDALAAAATMNHNNKKSNTYMGAAGLLHDPDKEKKIRKLTDKLASIQKLKDQIAEGKTLEKNQLDKMTKEQELLDELKTLKLS
eukprot:GFUD01018805.1.p1 GENE.GFUD01018805.1~~GFUD01018805.1.p1  ORF type:complete len:598 (+),score=151.66 GFUD01018805.1:66-1859(+)